MAQLAIISTFITFLPVFEYKLRTPFILIVSFGAFPQSLLENIGTIPYIGHSFLPLDALRAVIWKAALTKPESRNKLVAGGA